MIKTVLSVSEFKQIIKTSIENKVLSEEVYVTELEWDQDYCLYVKLGHMDEEGHMPIPFNISNIQPNHLYGVGQVFCKGPEYLLFLDFEGKVHLNEIMLTKHEEIHLLANDGIHLEIVFDYINL